MLAVTLLLACAALVSGGTVDLSNVADSTETVDEYLIYDIEGSLADQDVLDVFSSLNVQYKFRAISGQRFVVVVKKDEADNAVYSALTFPSGCRVRVYPAERISDFFAYYGVDGMDDEEVISLSNENLIMTEFTDLAYGTPEEEYKEAMKKLGAEYKEFNNNYNTRVFHLTSTMPFKAIVFVSIAPGSYDRVLLEGDAILGGPYQTNVETTPIVNM